MPSAMMFLFYRHERRCATAMSSRQRRFSQHTRGRSLFVEMQHECDTSREMRLRTSIDIEVTLLLPARYVEIRRMFSLHQKILF